MRTGRPRGGLDRAHASCYLADLSLTSWLTLYPHLQARGWWVLEGKRSEQSTWAAKHVPILGRANLTPRTWQIFDLNIGGLTEVPPPSCHHIKPPT